jgi:hypothetical protein
MSVLRAIDGVVDVALLALLLAGFAAAGAPNSGCPSWVCLLGDVSRIFFCGELA